MPSVQALISGAKLFFSLMQLLSFDSAVTQKFLAFTAMQNFLFSSNNGVFVRFSKVNRQHTI